MIRCPWCGTQASSHSSQGVVRKVPLMTKSITQVWAPGQQALAQCSAIEWTKAEVAVRNVVAPTPHPGPTSRLKGANVRWCVETKRPIRSNSFMNGRFAITFANEVGSYSVLYEAVTKLLQWTTWQVSDRVLSLMLDRRSCCRHSHLCAYLAIYAQIQLPLRRDSFLWAHLAISAQR